MNKLLLKGRLVAGGMTQKALCEKTGISLSVLNAKINGHYPFTVDEVVRICDVLGIDSPEEKEAIFL